MELTGKSFLPSTLTRTLDALWASPREKKLDYLSANIYERFGAPKAAAGAIPVIPWWEFSADSEIYGSYIRAYQD